MGFLIEMDDFGTGYSSLNMLSSLPFDVLKLDMRFAQSSVSQGKDQFMLDVVTEIAGHLGVKIVTEGVETKEQFERTRPLAIDWYQGNYFSVPLTREDLEKLA